MATTQTDFAALFANLTVEESSEPLPKIVRVRESLPNPFGPSILASIERNTTFSTYVPADSVSKTSSMIHAAAKAEGCGATVVANVVRDAKGRIVKDDEGKAQYVAERSGPNKGLVLVRYAGKPERKKASAPRVYSIVNDPSGEHPKALKHRLSGEIVARGSHEAMREALKAAKASAA